LIVGSVRAIPYLEQNAQAFFDECDKPEHPPNADKWDCKNRTVVQPRCAHYGLRDARDGGDLLEPYSYDAVESFASRYSTDYGGPWQIYWRQSMPGLYNPAFAEDGSPMKNWWPFLFY
jgi:hypothetical protein